MTQARRNEPENINIAGCQSSRGKRSQGAGQTLGLNKGKITDNKKAADARQHTQGATRGRAASLYIINKGHPLTLLGGVPFAYNHLLNLSRVFLDLFRFFSCAYFCKRLH